MKRSLISILVCALIPMAEAKKDFEISIGNTSGRTYAEGEVIELKGTGKQVQTEFMQNAPVSKENEKDIINNAFNEGSGVIILKGSSSKPKSTTQKVSQDSVDDEVSKQLVQNVSSKKTYGDLAKEIPIPTDFNILNQALSSTSHTAMPISGPPQGLPDFFGFKEVVSDKDIRGLINTLTNAGKRSKQKVDWSKMDLDVKTEEKAKENVAPEFELALTRVEREWYDALKKETQLMMLSGLPMKVVLVPSRDDLMYQFMLSDVAKGSEDRLRYKKFDDGIFSVLGMPLINGKKIPMCYLIFDNMIEDYANKILTPLQNRVGKEATASLVVGHNVGICLDELERQRKVNTKNTWFANEVHQIGLYADSFQSIFPRGMKANIFPLKEREITSTNSQRQYQQRVADGFAVLWAYNRGYKNAYEAFIEVKDYVNPTSTHYIVPALKGLKQKLIAMRTNTLTLSNIWKIARQNQKTVGVEKKIKESYEMDYMPQISELKQDKSSVNMRGLKTAGEMRNMNTLKNMNQVNTTYATAGNKVANMKDTRTFESTKNNQLATMNFNVRELIYQEPNRHEIIKQVNVKNDASVGAGSVKESVKPKSMNEVKRFGVTSNNNKVVEVDKAKNTTLIAGEQKTTVEEKLESVKQPVKRTNESEGEKIRLKDDVRESLLNGTLELESKGQLSF